MAKPSGHPVGVRGVWYRSVMAQAHFLFVSFFHSSLGFFFLLFINCQHFIFYFSALALVCVSRSFSICFSIILFCARRCVRLIYIYILFSFLIIFIRWNRAGLLSPALFAARSVVVLDSSVHFVITPLKFRWHSSA